MDLFKNYEKYNKFWGALIPVVVWGLNNYAGTDLSAAELSTWTQDAVLLLSPIFAYWMTNKT